MTARRKAQVGALLCAAASALWLEVMERVTVPQRRDGVYFKRGKSDDLWQCLDGAVLRRDPIRALWYLHKEPPLLDAVRALAASLHPRVSDDALPHAMDRTLFRFWNLLNSAIGGLLAYWLWVARGAPWGIGVAAAWAIHPSGILYATILDGTLMAALALLWITGELWRESRQPLESLAVGRLALAIVFAFLAKNTYQWYFVPVVIASLLLLRKPPRRVALVLLLAGLPIASYCGKQWLLFHTISTTTFAGHHYTGVVFYHPSEELLREIRAGMTFDYPAGAMIHKDDSHNTKALYENNLMHAAAFRRFASEQPAEALAGLWKSVGVNWVRFMQPSSRYAPAGGHPILDRLPWLTLYETLLAGWPWLALLGSAGLIWIGRAGRTAPLSPSLLTGLGIALPFFYVLAITMLSNRYEWSEAIRQRFVLEPTAIAFVLLQASSLVARRLTGGRSNQGGGPGREP